MFPGLANGAMKITWPDHSWAINSRVLPTQHKVIISGGPFCSLISYLSLPEIYKDKTFDKNKLEYCSRKFI